MNVPRKPRTAQDLLGLWDDLAREANQRTDDEAKSDAERFAQQRDQLAEGLPYIGVSLGQPMDAIRDHELRGWWWSVRKLYITCRVSHHLEPAFRESQVAAWAQQKEELAGFKAQQKEQAAAVKAQLKLEPGLDKDTKKARMEAFKAQQKDGLAQLKEAHHIAGVQSVEGFRATCKEAENRIKQDWGVPLDE